LANRSVFSSPPNSNHNTPKEGHLKEHTWGKPWRSEGEEAHQSDSENDSEFGDVSSHDDSGKLMSLEIQGNPSPDPMNDDRRPAWVGELSNGMSMMNEKMDVLMGRLERLENHLAFAELS
jgi:hypothetical protein